MLHISFKKSSQTFKPVFRYLPVSSVGSDPAIKSKAGSGSSRLIFLWNRSGSDLDPGFNITLLI
jgi:hypothetical protein